MTTIRRELRQKFLELLNNHELTSNWTRENKERFADSQADTALEVRGIAKVEQQKRGDIVGGILAYAAKEPGNTSKAIEAFESAFGITRPWDWYPDKPDDKRKTWADFRKFINQLYAENQNCFIEYFTWSMTPYVKGSLTALGIKRNPQDFPDSWSAFLAWKTMNNAPRKTDEAKPEYRPAKFIDPVKRFLQAHEKGGGNG